MRRLMIFISLIVMTALVYLIMLNHTDYVNINYLNGYLYTMDPENPNVSFAVKISTYTLIMSLCGFIVGAGVVSLIAGVQKDRLKSYKRELEKSAVSEYANTSKVKMLEAKIQTLEKAFNTVADERKKMELQIKELNDELENINKNNS